MCEAASEGGLEGGGGRVDLCADGCRSGVVVVSGGGSREWGHDSLQVCAHEVERGAQEALQASLRRRALVLQGSALSLALGLGCEEAVGCMEGAVVLLLQKTPSERDREPQGSGQ